jgi:ceramide glucosyltransferase
MTALVFVCVGCAIVAGGYQLFQLFAAWWFFRRTGRQWPGGVLPPVTVLKPLKGEGVDLHTNLVSFCRQDYPAPVQIVFGVTDAADPAIAIVQRIRREFPERDIVLSVGDAEGANRKIANLRHMMRYARHRVLIMSDADIRVRPDYLRTMIAPLADRSVGLTCCLYRGVGRFGVPSLVESLFINTDFVPMVLSAQILQRFRYAYGASIAMRRDVLDQIGGFAAIADYLADDYILGNRVARAGYRNVLMPYFVETVLDATSAGDVWRHLVRWSRTYRVQQPVGWFASVVTHATLWGILTVVATGGSPFGLALGLGAIAVRLFCLATLLVMLREWDTLRRLWLVPAKDLFFSAIWLMGFLGRDVVWSDQVLRVERDGRMRPVSAPEELQPKPAPAKAAGS